MTSGAPQLVATRHPSRGDRRTSVPPAPVRDIDGILLDHGLDLPMADIKAGPSVATERQLRRRDRRRYRPVVAFPCVEGGCALTPDVRPARRIRRNGRTRLGEPQSGPTS
jgi:hypothetical protein